MRLISCAHTADQILAESKDITRRYGWIDAKVGELLQVVRKGQGIPKGGHAEALRVIRVLTARREALSRLVDEPDYGRDEMRREGFPGLDPRQFIESFFAHVDDVVTRIEFEYVYVAGRPVVDRRDVALAVDMVTLAIRTPLTSTAARVHSEPQRRPGVPAAPGRTRS